MEKRRFVLPICFLIIVILMIFGVYQLKDQGVTVNILMLHMVTDKMPEDKELETLYITDNMLKKYCEYFKEKFTIVSLNEAYDIIRTGKKVENPNLLVFTFDDGYDNNYTLAYPILKEYGIKANINIIAKYSDEVYPGYLTWKQIKEMSDSGLIEIGSHTYNSHYYTKSYNGKDKPVLSTRLPDESMEQREERILNDLRLADDMITRNIGKKTNILAYPYGVPPNDLIDTISKEFGYDIQLMVTTGVNKEKDEFLRLNRFTVNGNEEPYELHEKMRLYEGLDFLQRINPFR